MGYNIQPLVTPTPEAVPDEHLQANGSTLAISDLVLSTHYLKTCETRFQHFRSPCYINPNTGLLVGGEDAAVFSFTFAGDIFLSIKPARVAAGSSPTSSRHTRLLWRSLAR